MKDVIKRPLRMVLAATTAAGACLLVPALALASKMEWSMFEDHTALIRSGAQMRVKTLDEIKALGADTLRVEVKWAEVAPDAGSRHKPHVNTGDPSQYPGFGPYDDLITRASAMGFRIMITLAPDAPRWATANQAPLGSRTSNYEVSSTEFAQFAAAVGERYSGSYDGLPEVDYFSIWNEPNHIYFLKPRPQAPRIYRRLVERGVPALRAHAAPAARVFVGELAPVGTATKVIGPLRFLQQWLCLDGDYHRLTGRKARVTGCTRFEKVSADGFAHHPYGPTSLVFQTKDVINLLAIRRLAIALDRSARAGRITAHLPIYSTEFGYQTNPPDPYIGTSPARQAALLNEKEEFSYSYPRLKSYAQYLLYDDAPRSGPPYIKWSGFQTGLRFPDGVAKPSHDAYKLPIVVHKHGSGVFIWGRVRPGTGVRYVQLQRRSGSHYIDDGDLIRTNSLGYFTALRSRHVSYRFVAYTGPDGNAASNSTTLGMSRTATPIS